VIFVHGLGSSAADVGTGDPAPFGDLLRAIAERHPRPGVCQAAAQPGRAWDGSPCVFRYVEDIAEASEDGPARRGPNDSQSGVRENAGKLARELAEVSRNAGGARVILIGYSMGGAIIRTLLALHPAEAALVEAVVLVDAVAQGSWGFSLIREVVDRASGPLSGRTMDLLRTMAAGAAAVDLRRPAASDLQPRSDLYREIAAVRPPSSASYYTFWGDVRITLERRLYAYDLPDIELPSAGDLGLLPGEPAPDSLPELGGQRFTPTELDAGREAWDVAHTARIRLSADVMSTLIERCGRSTGGNIERCRELLAERFDIPNQHTAIPFTMSRVEVDVPELGGRTTLLEAMLAAVGRNQP
jgi:pimeloyl-ACP methyl ester carboxylesterase